MGLEKLTESSMRLSIYIANVPLWMDYLELWDSFSKRIATIYLPDRKLPMLPTVLSDILCSLQKNSSRFALALDLILDNKTGKILDYSYKNVIINVKENHRYNTMAQREDKLYKSIFKMVTLMNKRDKYMCNIKNCHDIIAYLMILMNHKSAIALCENKTGIYRSMSFNNFKTETTVDNEEVQRFLINWHSTGGCYNKFANLSGHDALNLDKYLHITSPIRRLVDLLNIIELQTVKGLTIFSDSATRFYKRWTTEDSLNFINETMRSIRRVQSDCSLLNICNNDSSLLTRVYEGYIFNKIQRTDLMYQYQVYLLDIKVTRRFISSEDLSLNSYNKFNLYMFVDEDRLYKKIRLGLYNKIHGGEN